MKRILLALSLSWYGITGYAANQPNQLTQKIDNIRHDLQQKSDQRDNLQQELNKIETEYGEVSANHQQTLQQIAQQKNQIAATEHASKTNENQIRAQQQALMEQLRLYYVLQRQGSVKLLLNQQNLTQTERMLYYYKSLNEYRVNTIKQLQNSLTAINNHQQQLYAQYQVLQKLQQQQQAEERNLAQMKTSRSQLIAAITQNIATNKKYLEQTLAQLSAKPAPAAASFSNQSFVSQRGRLPWPTRGSILHYFNKPIANSELKWNGELITAADGQPVRAVAPGVVVFSKWLEGYGLLIIINHGNGYMTLYGRNHSLYKHEGDKVAAGDIIATVGQSGGYDKPALYFAIRYNAKPLDPNQWCSYSR